MLSRIVSESENEVFLFCLAFFSTALLCCWLELKAIKLGLELGLKIKVKLTEKKSVMFKIFIFQGGATGRMCFSDLHVG